MTCSYSTLLPRAGTSQRQRSMKRISSVPKYGTQVIHVSCRRTLCQRSSLKGCPLGSQSRLSVVPAIKGRQTSQESHLHHCVLANLKEYHYRPFLSSHLPTTDRLYPGCPARLLRCDLFYIRQTDAGVSLRPGYGSLNG